MAPMEGEDAYCTLLMSDNYLPGAQVLAHSLRDAATKKKLAVMVTLDSVGASTITELDKLYDYIIPVNRIVNKSPANLFLMDRWDLRDTFTKINLWQQRRFRKVVYLDADVVALRAPDELFDIEAPFAAAPDVGWPDLFNSGVMVLTPNMADYYSLSAMAQRGVSFDGADQGLLNTHFKDYHRISFRYNCTPSAHYQYIPAFRHFEADIAMLHFIGKDKPWSPTAHDSNKSSIYDELLGRWWAVHDRHYRVPAEESQQQSTPEDFQAQGAETYRDPYHATPTSHEPYHAPQEGAGNEPPATSSFTEPTRVEGPMHEHAPNEEGVRNVQIAQPEPLRQPPPPPPPPKAPFEAPKLEWDPAKSAPPVDSKPEAPNFPQQTYEMSQDPGLFVAPTTYPEPPKDLWYEVPKSPPKEEPLKPIFPWELRPRRITRVFAEDLPPPKPKAPSPPLATDVETQPDESAPVTPTAPLASPDPWSGYTTTNAWDEIPQIQEYVRRFVRRRSGNAQIGADDVSSPARQRLSFRLTDFPTEIERPSLPVTPALIGGPRFGGADVDDEGYFPPAAGVPAQEEWDPAAKLEELTVHQTELLSTIVKRKAAAPEEEEGEEVEGAVGAEPSKEGDSGIHDAELAQDIPIRQQTDEGKEITSKLIFSSSASGFEPGPQNDPELELELEPEPEPEPERDSNGTIPASMEVDKALEADPPKAFELIIDADSPEEEEEEEKEEEEDDDDDDETETEKQQHLTSSSSASTSSISRDGTSNSTAAVVAAV